MSERKMESTDRISCASHQLPSKDKVSDVLRLIPDPRIGECRVKMPTEDPANQVEVTPDVLSLQRVLSNRFTRNKLIASLIPISLDLSVKSRFISACEEYKSITDKSEKKQKARKIVATFVQVGSLYQMDGIPPSLADAAIAEKFEPALDQLNLFILEQLSQSEDIQREVQTLLSDVLSFDSGTHLHQHVASTVEFKSSEIGNDGVRELKQTDILSSAFYETVIFPPASPRTGPIKGMSATLTRVLHSVGSFTLLVQEHPQQQEEQEEEKTSSRKSQHSRSTSLGRRLLPRIGSKESVLIVNEPASEDVLKLERVIADRVCRHELIVKLLRIQADYSIRIRFCSALSQYEQTTDRADRKAKAKSIVTLFIQQGSMFQVHAVPPSVRQDLLNEKYDSLDDLRRFIMAELAVIDVVKKEVEVVLEKLQQSFLSPSSEEDEVEEEQQWQ